MLPWIVTTALASTVAGAGVEFTWTVSDGVVTAEMRAHTVGWVAVGFNGRPELDGSILIMGALRPEGSTVEEHVARPPNHPARVDLGGTAGLIAGAAQQADGWTTVTFQWRVDTADGLTSGIRVGEPVHLTLAWSRSDDFDHHSAERTLVTVDL